MIRLWGCNQLNRSFNSYSNSSFENYPIKTPAYIVYTGYTNMAINIILHVALCFPISYTFPLLLNMVDWLFNKM